MSKGHTISKKDKEKYTELFSTLDRDNDGRIDIHDLIAHQKSKSVSKDDASDLQVQVVIIMVQKFRFYSILFLFFC